MLISVYLQNSYPSNLQSYTVEGSSPCFLPRDQSFVGNHRKIPFEDVNINYINPHTLASQWSDLSEGVIAAVTLTTDDSSFTGALPGDGVAGSRLGANGETLAGIASVLAVRTVVVFLQEEEKTEMTDVLVSSSDVSLKES